jgi:hypothetical protein
MGSDAITGYIARVLLKGCGFRWSMTFSDLASPAEASRQTMNIDNGYAQAGNRFPLFGVML